MNRLMLMFALAASSLCAQDWIPSHIVAVDEYPWLARVAGTTGNVVVKCTLNKDGSVASAEILSGPALLREKTQQNAQLWKFHRTTSKGHTKEDSVTLAYQFRLEGGPKDTRVCSFVVDLPNVVHVVAPFPLPMID